MGILPMPFFEKFLCTTGFQPVVRIAGMGSQTMNRNIFTIMGKACLAPTKKYKFDIRYAVIPYDC
jgi:hypothetical protein